MTIRSVNRAAAYDILKDLATPKFLYIHIFSTYARHRDRAQVNPSVTIVYNPYFPLHITCSGLSIFNSYLFVQQIKKKLKQQQITRIKCNRNEV